MWALIESVLLPWPERSPGPRPDWLCLQGILFVLYNDIAWQLLPLKLGLGSGQTCWRRLDWWQKAGIFDQLHRILLAELNAVGKLDWSRACVDGSHSQPREKGGADTGPSPVDRRKTGSKHHLIYDGRDTPLKVITTAANVNDVSQTLALVGGIPSVVGRSGQPRRRTEALLGDKGYDSNPNRREPQTPDPPIPGRAEWRRGSIGGGGDCPADAFTSALTCVRIEGLRSTKRWVCAILDVSLFEAKARLDRSRTVRTARSR